MLLEALKKRQEGEELTEVELALLAEYDEQVAKETEKEKQIAKSLEEKVNQQSELEKTIEELKEKYNMSSSEAEKIKKEKEELEKKINEDTANIEDVRATLRKIADEQKEKALQQQKEEQEKQLAEQKKELQTRIEQMEEQLKQQLKINELNSFRQEVFAEKTKRPYLVAELDKILAEIEVNGIEKSKIIFNFLLESKNHEQEMETFKRKQEAGTNIFDEKKIKTEVKDTKDSFEEFLKRKNGKIK